MQSNIEDIVIIFFTVIAMDTSQWVYRKHKTDDPTFPSLLLALVFSFIRNYAVYLLCLETHARKLNVTVRSRGGPTGS